MKQSMPMIVGLLIALGVAGYYGYLLYSSQSAAPAQTSTVANTIRLDEQALNSLLTKDINGNLPITVTQDALGNPQPFTR